MDDGCRAECSGKDKFCGGQGVPVWVSGYLPCWCLHVDYDIISSDDSGFLWRQKRFVLKSPVPGKISAYSRGWAVGGSVLIILGAWVMFGMGIVWGLRASVTRLANQLYFQMNLT